MGKEIRWLSGAGTTRILPMGPMRQQNPEMMAKLRSFVPGSADARNRGGKKDGLTGQRILERIRNRDLDPCQGLDQTR